MNKYLQYLILAIVQGLSEILPISSSAHLLLISNAVGIPSSDLTLSIFLHLGSALAVICFFRHRLVELIGGFFRFIFKRTNREEFNEVIVIAVASIPAGIAGLLFQDLIEERLLTPFAIGTFFIVTGLVLLASSRKLCSPISLRDLKPTGALSIGLFQMVGILPGISRSGITYAGARACRLNSKDASELIFLMFLPVSLGSGVWETFKLIEEPVSIDLLPLLLAVVVVVILTYLSLKLFLILIKKDKMYYFSYYLLPLGLLLMSHGLYTSAF